MLRETKVRIVNRSVYPIPSLYLKVVYQKLVGVWFQPLGPLLGNVIQIPFFLFDFTVDVAPFLSEEDAFIHLHTTY